jgi:hypothetical protein
MKPRLLLPVLWAATQIIASAQVGVGTTTPDASAQLDISSSTLGFLPPRMTQDQRLAIVTPAAGLLVYQTDGTTPGLYIHDGTAWSTLSGKESALTFGAPFSRDANTISLATASGSQAGALTSTDWTTFNGKVAATRTISTTAPLTGGGTLAGDLTLSLPAATTSVSGYLANTDWSTFNSKIGGSGTANYVPAFTGSGTVGNSALFSAANGNVGIGTATPAAQLDVLSSNTFGISSTGSTTGSTGLYHIANSNAPTAWNLGVEGGAWASGAALGSLYIDKDGVGPKMTITPDGNVGIGTTTPLSKLQVYGTETGANWAGRGAFGGASSAVVLGQYNNKAYFGAHNAALDTWTDLAINPGGGNVGIGTTTPSVALDVNGSFKASGMPTIICPITTVAVGNNFPFGNAETLTGNISSDGSSITIGETGLYLISFALGFGNSSHGWITVNGAGRLVSWTNTDPDIFTTTTVAPLNSGDVIRLYLYSGTFSTDANRKFICVTKLH